MVKSFGNMYIKEPKQGINNQLRLHMREGDWR